jgi:hypothetical protein
MLLVDPVCEALFLRPGKLRAMEIDREMLIQIGVSLVGVGVFIGAIVLIGVFFADNGLTEQGALGLVGSIILFILVMTALGYWLSARES